MDAKVTHIHIPEPLFEILSDYEERKKKLESQKNYIASLFLLSKGETGAWALTSDLRFLVKNDEKNNNNNPE